MIESPYRLEGTVSDTHLSGLSINGQAVGVIPGSVANTFTFSIPLALPPAQDQPITLEAWDTAGNRTSRDLVLRSEIPVAIEVIAPQTVARFTGLAPDNTIEAVADNGAPVAMTLAENAATTDLNLVPTASAHEVIIRVKDAAGTVIAQASSRVTFVNTDNQPLKLERHEPANAQTGVEPNDFVALYFNKPIDPAKLQVSVRETAHGLDYDLSGEKGADLTTPDTVKLLPVDRDQEPVPGGLALFPGNRMIAFHPARDFVYTADIYVDVTYDGQELDRFTFKIRPLPTLLQGIAADQQ